MAQTIAFGGLCLLLCSRTLPAADDLIVPNLRVGPITRTSTESQLLKIFGKLAVKQPIELGEGETEPGLVIYPDDPTRRLAITWNDQKQPSIIFLCYQSPDPPCRWHTSTGITLGTTLKDLERLNRRPFEMVVWGSDVGGNVVDYRGGALDRQFGLTLVPRIDKDGGYLPHLTDGEFASVQGERFVLSTDPVLQKLNPYVAVMHLTFPSAK